MVTNNTNTTQAYSVSVPAPPPTDVKGDNAMDIWTFFKMQYENYAIATELSNKPEDYRSPHYYQ